MAGVTPHASAGVKSIAIQEKSQGNDQENNDKSQRGSPERRIFFLGAMRGNPGWALRVRPVSDPDPVPDPQGPGWAHPGPLGPYWGHTWGPTGDICVFGKNNKSIPPLALGPKT